MSLTSLTLDSLKDLDMGKAGEAFQAHLKRAAIDCMDRPGDRKPRRVILELALEPVVSDDGSCEEVRGQFRISSAVPKHQTRVYSFGARKNGALAFNPDSPADVKQTTLLPDEE